MMRKFEKPSMEVRSFHRENILTTSGTQAFSDAAAAANASVGEDKVIKVTI